MASTTREPKTFDGLAVKITLDILSHLDSFSNIQSLVHASPGFHATYVGVERS